MITEYTVDAFTAEMFATLQSFEHLFSYNCPEREVIEISTVGSSSPIRVAGRRLPATITIHDEDDALLFKIKFFSSILQTINYYKGNEVWD